MFRSEIFGIVEIRHILMQKTVPIYSPRRNNSQRRITFNFNKLDFQFLVEYQINLNMNQTLFPQGEYFV